MLRDLRKKADERRARADERRARALAFSRSQDEQANQRRNAAEAERVRESIERAGEQAAASRATFNRALYHVGGAEAGLRLRQLSQQPTSLYSSPEGSKAGARISQLGGGVPTRRNTIPHESSEELARVILDELRGHFEDLSLGGTVTQDHWIQDISIFIRDHRATHMNVAEGLRWKSRCMILMLIILGRFPTPIQSAHLQL